MQVFEKRHGEFTISTEPARIDFDIVYQFLRHQSYWAQGISLDILRRAVENSLVFGIYHEPMDQQVGFARVITDFATFAYICDLFILPAFRGLGLSKQLIQTMLEHPDLQGLRRWLLLTKDAHSLYEPFGFTTHPNPENILQIHNPSLPAE